MRLFIDTSIFVDVLRSQQVESSKSLFRSLQSENAGFASAITVAELSVGAYRSPGPEEDAQTFVPFERRGFEQ